MGIEQGVRAALWVALAAGEGRGVRVGWVDAPLLRERSFREAAGAAVPRGAAGGWPEPFALELPPGALAPGERLALYEGAVERPCRVSTWRSWPDGSPSWVAVAPCAFSQRPARLELRPTRAPSSPPRLARVVERRTTRLVGGSGELATTGGVLAWSCAAAALELDLAHLEWEADGLRERGRGLTEWSWLGPDGGGAAARATVRSEAEGASAALELRLEVASDGSEAELELAFTVGREMVLRDWSLDGRVRGSAAELRHGAWSERATAKRPAARTFATEASGQVAPTAAGEEAPDLRIGCGSGRDEVELLLLDAALARPSGALLQHDGRFTLRLVAGPLLLHPGQVVRRRLRLRAGAAVRRAVGRPRLVAVAASASGRFAPEVEERLARWQPFLAARLGGAARLDDRGCYLQPDGSFANGEYDLGGSLLWIGRALADGTWLALGEVAARHTLDFDRDFTPPAGRPAGLFAQHGRDHASGKVEAGHQWIGGALELARSCGDAAALATAEATVGALATWRAAAPGDFAGPERRVAWPLAAAVELARSTGSTQADGFAKALLDSLAARQLPDGFLDGDRRRFALGERLWVNSWVSLGITVDALARAAAWQAIGAPDAAGATRAQAGRLVRGVVAAAGRDERSLADVVLVDAEAGLAVETRAALVGGDALLAAAGLQWWAAQPEAARERAALEARAAALRERGWRDLATPSAEAVVGFAKALRALKSEAELRPP